MRPTLQCHHHSRSSSAISTAMVLSIIACLKFLSTASSCALCRLSTGPLLNVPYALKYWILYTLQKLTPNPMAPATTPKITQTTIRAGLVACTRCQKEPFGGMVPVMSSKLLPSEVLLGVTVGMASMVGVTFCVEKMVGSRGYYVEMVNATASRRSGELWRLHLYSR